MRRPRNCSHSSKVESDLVSCLGALTAVPVAAGVLDRSWPVAWSLTKVRPRLFAVEAMLDEAAWRLGLYAIALLACPSPRVLSWRNQIPPASSVAGPGPFVPPS